MNDRRINVLALSIATVLGGASLRPATVHAAEGSLALEEIVVTAQKREENLQSVGISVTAFTQDQMRGFGFREATDITAQVPGLSAASSAGAGAINAFSIRGVTQSDFAGVHEAPVAVYVDEAYISQNTVTNFSMYDLARVEVLRGPQGTLFGRNATGGLINFVTAKPSQDFGAYTEVLYGSKNRLRLEGAVGGGLTDTVSARLSAVSNTSDGLMTNRIGKDGQAANDYSVRGQVLFEPSDLVSVLLKGQYSKDDSDRGNFFHRVGDAGRFLPAPATDFFGYRSANEGDPWTGAWDFHGFNKVDVTQFTAKADWKVSDHLTLTYVGDYQDIDEHYGEDSDVSPANVFNYTQTSKVKQWSQEARLAWQGDRATVVGGLYYLNIDGKYSTDSLVFGQADFDWSEAFYGIPEPGGYNLVSSFPQTTETWAVFGQMDYDLTDQLKLTVGARWTDDRKDYHFQQGWDNVDGLYVFFQGVESPGNVPYFDFKDNYSHSDWSGKIQLDYKQTDDLLWYGSINRGIKGGGFNAPVDASGLLAVNESGQFIPFDQNNAAMHYDGEVLTSYEVGVKSTLFDGRARFNASAFYYDYADNQIYNMVGLTQIVFNSNGSMWGGELELGASPVDGLDLMLGVSLLDATVDLPPGVRPDGKTSSDPVVSPKLTLNGLARYEWSIGGDRSLSVQGDFSWKDKQIFNLSNTPVVKEGSHAVVNASFGYASGASGLYATAFVRNLFDEKYRIGAFDTTASFGSVEGVAGPERWYGVTVGYRWH
jgi:iron complex outermembrane receptor protein